MTHLLHACLLVTSIAVNDPPFPPSLEGQEWLTTLRAHSVEVRDRALAELPSRMLDPQALALALRAAAADPEIEMRLRAAAAAAPYLAPALARAALAGEPDCAPRARDLFRELLTAEIARRAPIDRLLKRSERTTLFMAGDYVGALPPLERPVAFERGVAWLAANGGWTAPLVLDPSLAGERVAALSPPEWWPSTAGGMLKRWLSERALDVVDLGIVTVITTDAAARAFERADREAKDSTRRSLGFEHRAADWLTERMLAPERDPAAVAARFRLWLALALPDGGVAALATDREALPEVWLRSLVEGAGSDGVVEDLLAALGSGSREAKGAFLFELGRGRRLGASTARGLAEAHHELEAAYLECKQRITADSDRPLDEVGDRASVTTSEVIAAITVATPWRVEHALDRLCSVERAGSDLDPIAIACAWTRSRGGSDPLLTDRLLAARDETVRSIGWYLVGARAARGEPIPRRRACAVERRAFSLGLAFADAGRPSPWKCGLVRELAPALDSHLETALLAYLRALDTKAALAAVGSLKQPGTSRLVLAHALVHRCVVDVIDDDDRLATRLLFELRRIEDAGALFAPLYDDAAAAFSAEERGRIALAEPIDRLWLTD